MNTAAIYDAAFYSALKPTWRLLWNQLRALHGQTANRRAEKLVLRFMARDWPAARIEALLARLIERDHTTRGERHRHSLAQANGWGSAGQCPASHSAKTPAAREQVSHLVAAARKGGDASACASAQRTPRGVIV